MASNAIIAQIKLKMESFLSEEIALTDKWGKPSFVGSIEDLIKKQFDDVILRPVDSDGKTLQGCTSLGTTWIEWRIKSMLNNQLNSHLSRASKSVNNSVEEYLDEKIIALKNDALKKQVNEAFTSMLKSAS